MVTYTDIQGLIALAIRNNRNGFIAAMNSAGYPVLQNISEDELYQAALQILSEKGIQALRPVLNRVPINKNSISQPLRDVLTAKFAPANQRSGNWFNNAVTFIGDLIGGSSISITDPSSQTSTSSTALPPWVLGLTVAAGTGLIIAFRKFAVVVIGIIVIVFGVVLYGIFAKKSSTTVSGGGTTTTEHGGVGAVILAAFGL